MTPPFLLGVTGAGGFLGSAVVAEAAARGIAVAGTGRRASQSPAAFVVADILEPAGLDRVIAGADVVVHAAGLAHAPRAPARDFERVNVDGTRNVMAAAGRARVKRVVLISSVSVYGGGSALVDESRQCEPVGPYAISKLASERVAAEIAAANGTELVVLRMATIYGEGDRGNVARLIRALDLGRFIWIGDGSNRKSLVYRDDAAGACLAAAAGQSAAGVFNVSAPPAPMCAIVDGISKALGRRSPRLRVPAGAARAVARAADAAIRAVGGGARFEPTIAKWLSEEVFSAARLESAAGWIPRTSLDEGLERQVEAYRRARGATS